MTEARFFTIGHSTRPADVVVTMLHAAGAGMLADVRTFPHSRSNPVFNIETFPDLLSGEDIEYRHFPALGGRRNRQEGVDPSVNALWRERAFHNYADYALGEEFALGLAELVKLGLEQPVAIMCSEAVWWRCHRRIIADYLLHRGIPVYHLMGRDRIVPARPTEAATGRDDYRLVYPLTEKDART